MLEVHYHEKCFFFPFQNQSNEIFIDQEKRRILKNVMFFAIHFMKDVA